MQQDEVNGSKNPNERKSENTAQEKNKGIQPDSPQRNQGRGLGRGGGGKGRRDGTGGGKGRGGGGFGGSRK